MSPEATAGLYLTLAAGLLAAIGMLVLQLVVSRFRRWEKKRREMVSYLRRREGKRGAEPTFHDAKAEAGVFEWPSRAHTEVSVQRHRSKADSLAHEARTEELLDTEARELEQQVGGARRGA
jgi:hypothetical protein